MAKQKLTMLTETWNIRCTYLQHMFLLLLSALPHLACIPYLTWLCQQSPIQYKASWRKWECGTEDLWVPACGKNSCLLLTFRQLDFVHHVHVSSFKKRAMLIETIVEWICFHCFNCFTYNTHFEQDWRILLTERGSGNANFKL